MMLPSIAASGLTKTMVAVSLSLHPAAAHDSSRYVTVQAGNTLSSISQHAYGKQADWPAVWWANRHSVPNPSSIRVGQRLLLPSTSQVTAQMKKAAQAATPHATQAAAPAAGTQAAPAEATGYYSGSGSFESCVIAAESGGNAGAVNPYSGAGGLYGFLPSTWRALGYSGLPEDASVSEQNAAFAKEYAESGSSAWAAYDGC